MNFFESLIQYPSNDLCNIAVAVLSAIFMTLMVDFGSSVVLEFVIQTVVITFVILIASGALRDGGE